MVFQRGADLLDSLVIPGATVFLIPWVYGWWQTITSPCLSDGRILLYRCRVIDYMDFLIGVLFILFYAVLVGYVLPRLGVPT